MLQVDGCFIDASVREILYALQEDLQSIGVNKLHRIKNSFKSTIICCPFPHGTAYESNPSCSIMDTGVYKCFSCGKVGFITEIIGELFGEDKFYGLKWLIDNFALVSVENRREIPLDFSRGEKVAIQKDYTEELNKYRTTHPYMYKRKLTDEIIKAFDVGYDPHFLFGKQKHLLPTITFPVRNEKGTVLFIARRSITGKIFILPEDIQKPVYGVYELEKVPSISKSVIICESIINALTCWSYGYRALALFGTGTPYQYDCLKRLPVRKYILALDPDRAGREGTKKLREALETRILTTELNIPQGKDINDLSKSEFENLKERY